MRESVAKHQLNVKENIWPKVEGYLIPAYSENKQA